MFEIVFLRFLQATEPRKISNKRKTPVAENLIAKTLCKMTNKRFVIKAINNFFDLQKWSFHYFDNKYHINGHDKSDAITIFRKFSS